VGGKRTVGRPAWHNVSNAMVLVPEGRQLFTDLTVWENLLVGGYHNPDRRLVMQEILERFPRLQERAKQLAGTLSGGEQQMLALGRALVAEPKFILLDEPSMGLAPLMVQEIFHIIKQLKDDGVTVFLVEQNAIAALSIADRATSWKPAKSFSRERPRTCSTTRKSNAPTSAKATRRFGMKIFDLKHETLRADELQQLQLERLQALLVRLKRNVRRYRELLGDARVESLDDLARLPVTQPDELVRSFPYGMFALPLREVIRLYSLVGPAGKQLVTGHTHNDLTHWGRLVARQLVASGMTANDVIQICLGSGLSRDTSGYALGAQLIEASVIAEDAFHLDFQLATLQNYRPTALITTPPMPAT